jgi:hypothetical protein
VREGDSKRRRDYEIYYTGLLGYEFKNNFIVELLYSHEKNYSNLDYVYTSSNDVLTFSLTYRFHLHKAAGDRYRLRRR